MGCIGGVHDVASSPWSFSSHFPTNFLFFSVTAKSLWKNALWDLFSLPLQDLLLAFYFGMDFDVSDNSGELEIELPFTLSERMQPSLESWLWFFLSISLLGWGSIFLCFLGYRVVAELVWFICNGVRSGYSDNGVWWELGLGVIWFCVCSCWYGSLCWTMGFAYCYLLVLIWGFCLWLMRRRNGHCMKLALEFCSGVVLWFLELGITVNS